MQELTGGSPTANLLEGGVDENFLRTDSAGSWNFLADALGSTVALADANGVMQTQYTYDPYGNTTATGLSTSNPAQYTGRENDATGLYYYRARYYSPQMGRFVSEDPLQFAAGVNFYSYNVGDPINSRDPLGLCGALCPVWGGGELGGEIGLGVAGPPGAAVGTAIGVGVGAVAVAAYLYYENHKADNPADSVPDSAPSTAGRKPPEPDNDPCKQEGAPVLGRYPGNGQLAQTTGAPWLNLPPGEWSWPANTQWLDQYIEQGMPFQLSSPASDAQEGTTFARELQYLEDHGYKLGCGGTRYIP